MTTKQCSKCQEVKATSEFSKNKRRKDGIDGVCKACTRARYKAWEQTKLQDLTTYRQQYYLKRREQILTTRIKSYSELSADDKRRRQLKKYNLTLKQFQALLEQQANLCDICREPMTTPHVDHDHETGRVRGLLCGDCNTAIGYLRDDPGRAINAAAYLQKHQVSQAS